jgi:hypothetical protein
MLILDFIKGGHLFCQVYLQACFSMSLAEVTIIILIIIIKNATVGQLNSSTHLRALLPLHNRGILASWHLGILAQATTGARAIIIRSEDKDSKKR